MVADPAQLKTLNLISIDTIRKPKIYKGIVPKKIYTIFKSKFNYEGKFYKGAVAKHLQKGLGFLIKIYQEKGTREKMSIAMKTVHFQLQTAERATKIISVPTAEKSEDTEQNFGSFKKLHKAEKFPLIVEVTSKQFEDDEAEKKNETGMPAFSYDLTQATAYDYIFFTYEIKETAIDYLEIDLGFESVAVWLNSVESYYDSSKISMSLKTHINWMISPSKPVGFLHFYIKCFEYEKNLSIKKTEDFLIEVRIFPNIRKIFKGKMRCTKFETKAEEVLLRGIKKIEIDPKPEKSGVIVLEQTRNSFLMKIETLLPKNVVIENLEIKTKYEELQIELLADRVLGNNHHIISNKFFVWEVRCYVDRIIPFSIKFQIGNEEYKYLGEKKCFKENTENMEVIFFLIRFL